MDFLQESMYIAEELAQSNPLYEDDCLVMNCMFCRRTEQGNISKNIMTGRLNFAHDQNCLWYRAYKWSKEK
jgi:hypothetical protein